MEMIAHSYISDTTPDAILDIAEGFPNELGFKEERKSRRGPKSIRMKGFGGIRKASGGRQGGNRGKPRAKRQKTTRGRGKKSTRL